MDSLALLKIQLQTILDGDSSFKQIYVEQMDGCNVVCLSSITLLPYLQRKNTKMAQAFKHSNHASLVTITFIFKMQFYQNLGGKLHEFLRRCIISVV